MARRKSSQPRAAGSASGSKVPLNGLLRNGTWYCKQMLPMLSVYDGSSPSLLNSPCLANRTITSPGNCEPRKPALFKQVKKKTANEGRWFWTCADGNKTDKNSCDLFIWKEDAQLREQGAAPSNDRGETDTTPRKQKRQTTIQEIISPSKDMRYNERTPIKSPAIFGKFKTPQSTSAAAPSSTLKTSNPITEDLFSGDDDDEMAELMANTPVPAMTPKTPSAGSKRKRTAEDEYSDLSAGEEEQLIAMTDLSSSQSSSQGQGQGPGPQATNKQPITPATTRPT
ncbi:hypothetical protein F4778DRAFT_227521 [Xylariomycetidae sp. FL2044]|nr:hypothetical protein F4778DRAFT_227521 [Xylariomycetidae sp. FL2044]